LFNIFSDATSIKVATAKDLKHASQEKKMYFIFIIRQEDEEERFVHIIEDSGKGKGRLSVTKGKVIVQWTYIAKNNAETAKEVLKGDI